jgi:hypothetical protein
VWVAVVVLSIVLVVGGAIAGYEIHHLQTQVNGLQSSLGQLEVQLYEQGLRNLANQGK